MSEQTPEPSATPSANPAAQRQRASQLAQALRHELQKALIGQVGVIDDVLTALLAGGHILVEGVPGLGKTLLVRALARCFDGAFARIQFTPDLMPSDVTGHAVYDLASEQFKLRKGPAFTNLLLADEINRAPAKTQSALLEAMQEGQVTIEGESFPLQPPFMALATQNPVEQEGTYPLPEAQLDRFLFKLLIGYPRHQDEVRMVAEVTGGRSGGGFELDEVVPVVGAAELVAMQQGVARVAMDPAVIDYAVRIVAATRKWPGIALGAGPRGSIALVRAARAQAVLEGRDFATPDDVRAVALPALRHRIALAAELQIDGQSPDEVLRALLARVEAPRK